MKKTILLFSILLTMGVTQTFAYTYSYTTPSGTITITISHVENSVNVTTNVIFQNNNTGNSITINNTDAVD